MIVSLAMLTLFFIDNIDMSPEVEVGQTWIFPIENSDPFKDQNERFIYKVIAIDSGYVQYNLWYSENADAGWVVHSSTIKTFKLGSKMVED